MHKIPEQFLIEGCREILNEELNGMTAQRFFIILKLAIPYLEFKILKRALRLELRAMGEPR